MNYIQLQKQANEYLNRDQYNKSIALYEQCIDTNPEELSNYWNLGLAFLLEGEESLAQTVWLSVFSQGDEAEIDRWTEELIQVLSSQAIRYTQSQNLPSATKIYEQIIELDENYTEGYLGLGIINLLNSNIDQSISYLNQSLALKNDLPEAYYHLALCWKEKEEIDKGIAYLKQAIGLRPNFPEAYYNLGIYFKQKEDLDEAILHLKKTIELNPNLAEAHSELGTCLLKQEKIDEAIIEFQQAIEIKPDFAKAYSNLGASLQKKDEIKKAISYLRKAIELQPNFPEPYLNIAICLQKEYEYDEAIEYFYKAIDIKPDNPESYLSIGIFFLQKKQFNQAINWLEKSLELQPEYPEVYLNLGINWRKKGVIDKAINKLQKAIELKPDFPDAYYHLGIYLKDIGQLDEAFKQLQQALILKPDFTKAHKDLDELRNCEQAGYFPILRKGYRSWDAMLFKDDNIYRLLYLTGDASSNPFWTTGEIAAAISTDLQTWQYQGITIPSKPEHHWESGRILAGSIYKENETYYLFYSAAPSQLLLEERIGLAISTDGITWKRFPNPFLELDTRFYAYRDCIHQGEPATHYPWRDPYIVKEPNTGRYYMFMTANGQGNQSSFLGCVGCAVADKIDGSYQILPPAAYPLLEGTEEGIYVEMERPQVIYQHGQYHLFFSITPEGINPKWLKKVGRDGINGSSLHWYVSDKIMGPYKAVSEKPIVKGSDKTELYGTNFIQTPKGEFIAYGFYQSTFTLEISPHFPVRWDKDHLEILIS